MRNVDREFAKQLNFKDKQFPTHTRFRVDLHSVVVWISRNFLVNTSAISEV